VKKILLFISLCLFGFNTLAQEVPQTDDLPKLTKQMEKANKTLQKKIDHLKAKLTKKLKKSYPDLSADQLDSLREAEIGEIPVEIEEALMQDTVLQQIKEWKTTLQNDLSSTPPNLDIAQDINVSIKELEELQSLYEKVKIPELKAPDLKSKAKELISKSEWASLGTKADDLTSLVKDYKNGFEGLDEKILARLTSIDEVKQLQEQQQRMAAYKPLPEGYREQMEGFQTNDFVKEKLEAKAEMIEKIGGPSLQEKFDAAQTKMSDAKEKFGSLESLKDAPKHAPNPYKDDPFLKRIKWGGNFQLGKSNPTTVDFAGQAAYLLNARARFGLGVSYRLEIGKDFKYVDFNDQVLGTRAFFDYTVFKSIYLEGLGQWDRSKPKAGNNEISSKPVWTPSAMLGAGNRFNLTKKLSGNFTALYNFLHNEKSTNPSPWIFRVGFEF
jgi:hypothetical protein